MAVATEQSLWKIKLAHRAKSFWYPYATLRNVAILERLATMAGLNLLQLCRGQYGKIADIGAADGDLAFFLEEQGLAVEVIENESTNFNRLEGARILQHALDSSVTIRSVDLDSQFPLSDEKYDTILLLGTLYHLKSPFLILERLARMTRYCFVSTRIAKQTADGQPLSRYPIAYLLGAQECNNDDTNFWIFSEEGFKRLIDRTGWSVLSYLTIGDTTNSTPADPDRDERAFCLLQSKTAPALTASPNPVPAGEGAGKTTISWDTGDKGDGKVYVSTDGGEESLFSAGQQGSRVANWIREGSSYEFRLYNSNHAKLLDKVVVTKPSKTAPTLIASPNPVPAGEGAGKTTISWNTANGDTGKVYVSTDGREESLFASSRRGSAAANWIQTGSIYEFRLYNSEHTELFANVTVTSARR
jgi:tRNA (mo5U34)-methyltransferase